MGNLTSQLPTMFWILKSKNFAGKPSFWMILAYFLAARRESSSLFAPVHTILPEEKIRAVVLGSRILMITAAKRFGLYSALRAWRAIFLRSNLQLRLTVETMFLAKKTIQNWIWYGLLRSTGEWTIENDKFTEHVAVMWFRPNHWKCVYGWWAAILTQYKHATNKRIWIKSI